MQKIFDSGIGGNFIFSRRAVDSPKIHESVNVPKLYEK